MTAIPGVPSTVVEARGNVARWRRRLQGAAVLRALLAGGGGGALAASFARAVSPSPGAPTVAGFVVAAAVGTWLWWRAAAARLTPVRTALWLEEHEPSLRYALVSVADGEVTVTAERTLAHSLGAVSWDGAAWSALRRSLLAPAALAAAGAVAWVVAPSAAARPRAGGDARVFDRAGGRGADALGAVTATIRPPRYTGRAEETGDSPALVRAYPGSTLIVDGSGPAAATRVTLDGRPLATAGTDGRWNAQLTTGRARALLRIERGAGGSHLLALEPLIDSAPVVTMRSPARDTVLRAARGTIPLAADVHDDLGLASATFEYIVSSGEGERFTFRSGTLGTLPSGIGREGALRTSLALAALALGPGDVVHLRAVARDRNDVSGPGVGSSESRTIRIARADEYDSVAVEQAPPSDADKSVISQRMLINLTEALLRRAPRLARADVVAESRRIGRDQARLRKQVSDIIFARLGDSPDGEHFHGDGHAHAEGDSLGNAPLTPEQLLKAAERATQGAGNVTDFEHDETPVVAINRPMLEAYNAMWDAGRALEGGEPSRAIKPMYVALAAIQRARAAERLYLRGAPPTVVVDLARVRLAGKDRGEPGARTPRPATDAARRPLLARFARAIDLLPRDAAAAVDSLIVLRLAVADTLPAAATALEGAIGELRAARDATAPLLRARRALDGALVARDSLTAWGGIR